MKEYTVEVSARFDSAISPLHSSNLRYFETYSMSLDLFKILGFCHMEASLSLQN
jgi:hypothetical protein